MKNATKKVSKIAAAVAGTVAAFTANEKACAAAIVKAYSGAFKAEDLAFGKGSGAFGLCTKAFVSGATFKGMEAAQPSLVGDKVPNAEGKMVKTRLRSAWDSAKSIITRSHAAGFDLVDAKGEPVTKGALASQLAALKAEPGAKTGNAADGEAADGETVKAAPSGTQSADDTAKLVIGTLADAKSKVGARLRSQYLADLEAIVTMAKAEAKAEAQKVAAAAKHNSVKAEAKAKAKAEAKAKIAADKAATDAAKANPPSVGASMLAEMERMRQAA